MKMLFDAATIDRSLNKLIGALLILLVFALPWFYQQRVLEKWERNDILLLVLVGAITAIYLSFFKKIKWTYSLIVLSMSALFVLIQMLVGSNHDLSSCYIFLMFISLIAIYAFLKESIYLHTPLFVAVYVFYIWMVLLGCYQVLHFKTNAFALTGWMVNSGYYSNFLVSLLPVMIALLKGRNIKSDFQKTLLRGVVVLGILLICLSKGRAAMIGLAIAAFFIYRKFFQQYFRSWVKMLILIPLLAGVIVCLYCIKPDSFVGRWMIYKVSWNLWQLHPWGGVGAGRLGVFFNSTQAAYCSKISVPSNSLTLIDDTTEAFNLFLQVGVEYGWIGILILCVFIFLIFKHWQQLSGMTLLQEASLAGLIGIFSAAMFSNPFHMPIINFLAILYLSCFFKNEKIVLLPFNISKRLVLNCCLFTTLWVFYFLVLQLYSLQQWKTAVQIATYQNFQQSRVSYQAAFKGLKYDGAFLYNYGAEAMLADEPQLAICILDKAALFCDASSLYLFRGQAYLKAGRFQLAVKDFLKAYAMVPSRMYPRYLLWKYYQKYGPREQEFYWRNLILNYPPKVSSEWTDQWVEEVKRYHHFSDNKNTTDGKDHPTRFETVSAYRHSR